MAEQQKIVDLPKETTETPAPVTTVGETAPVEAKPVEEAPVAATTTEDKVTEEAKPAEAVEETKAEEKKEEVTPIEEGHLGHKAQGLSFPKNLIASKEYFFFGTDAVEPKTLSSYQRSEKSAETAQSNIAWASHTGKGLLFVGDKKAPSSIINLSDAKEPEVDGSNKFTLTSKGNKHTFKAANTAERDNWVSQLKLKIAEAKELAASVTESETYKNTIESFKPAKKEEKPVVEEAAKTEETPAVADEPVKEETPVAAAATEESPKEAAKEEPKVEEPKRRSASRKRASFFGFGGKKDSAPKSPKEEVNKKLEETPATETVPATEAPVAPTEAPTVEAEAPKVDDVPATTEPAPIAGETAATEEVKTPEEKPTATKRNSFFGGVFGKKEKKVAEPKAAEPAEEVISPKTEETAPVTATDAPVIPPVEPTTPLEAGVTNPGNAPVETVDVSATTPTVTEPKKDVKEKRKSSLPFAFGKRDKSPAPAAEGEKTEKAAKSSPFSKFRATIKGKSATPKAEDKPAEEAAKEETAVPVEETKATEETPVEAVAAPTTEQTPVVAETENKPENVSTSTPAPVTAAA